MANIRCQNVYCVYFKECFCSLSAISLDVLGVCEEMMLVDLEEDFLEEKRVKVLARISEECA